MARRARWLLVTWMSLVLVACGEFRPIGPDYHYLRHRVQPGDTLYSIAFRFGYDYREVAAWNHVLPPYNIRVGEELLILAPDRYPSAEDSNEGAAAPVTVAQAPKPPAKTVKSPKAPVKPPKAAVKPAKPIKPANAKPPEPTQARVVTNIRWSWPTEGKLVARFAAGTGRKGVDVSGRSGQPVKAAAEGEVVYSGNGLIGYGNLVIIKHDDVFLSAYGHNRRLMVKEGDKVKPGQVIAEMGQHPKSGSILHFEIRRHGKPVDPLLYLPNQPS